jgi:hypothetical protein
MHLDVRPNVVGSGETADLLHGTMRVASAVHVTRACVDKKVALAGLAGVGTLPPLIPEMGQKR